jgi:hypothetical protein
MPMASGLVMRQSNSIILHTASISRAIVTILDYDENQSGRSNEKTLAWPFLDKILACPNMALVTF